jgi:hypothetical protein
MRLETKSSSGLKIPFSSLAELYPNWSATRVLGRPQSWRGGPLVHPPPPLTCPKAGYSEEKNLAIFPLRKRAY